MCHDLRSFISLVNEQCTLYILHTLGYNLSLSLSLSVSAHLSQALSIPISISLLISLLIFSTYLLLQRYVYHYTAMHFTISISPMSLGHSLYVSRTFSLLISLSWYSLYLSCHFTIFLGRKHKCYSLDNPIYRALSLYTYFSLALSLSISLLLLVYIPRSRYPSNKSFFSIRDSHMCVVSFKLCY